MSTPSHRVASSAFPYGSYNFVNFSDDAILVQGGDKTRPVRLDPGKTHVFTFNDDRRVVTLRIADTPDGQSPRLIRQTNFSITPDWREMVFFFNGPQSGRIRMRHLVDTMPAREE